MFVVEARGILERLGVLEDQPISDNKLFFLVIEGLIGQIGRYGQELDAALAGHDEYADFHRLNLWDLLRELEHLTLDDPLLLSRIGLIRVAFAASFQRATVDVAALDGESIRKNSLARITLPS